MRRRLVKPKHSTDFCFGVLHSFREPTLAPILRGTCDCDPRVAGGLDNSLEADKSLSLKSLRFYGFTLLELLVFGFVCIRGLDSRLNLLLLDFIRLLGQSSQLFHLF